MSVKKLALLFSHPEVTLWARLLPWGHFVIFHSGTGSPADTLSQDWENLPKLKATGGPPQSTSAHTEPPQCLCLVPDAGTCVCPAQHLAVGTAYVQWAAVVMWPELEGARPLHPTTLRPGTCHSRPRAVPNTSEKSHEFVSAATGERQVPRGTVFGVYGVRIEFRKSSWMCAPSPESNSPVFAPPVSAFGPASPCLMPPPAGPPHQKTSPPRRIWEPFISLWSESPFL